MTVTAEGCVSVPFAQLATLVANCATFQAAVGAANAAAALEFIDYPEFVPAAPDENGYVDVPAGAVITEDDQCQFSYDCSTGRETGELLLTIRLPVNESLEESSKDALLTYCNVIGKIFREMGVLSSTPDGSTGWFMTITNITKVSTADYCAYRHNPNPNIARKQFYGSTYKVTWI